MSDYTEQTQCKYCEYFNQKESYCNKNYRITKQSNHCSLFTEKTEPEPLPPAAVHLVTNYLQNVENFAKQQPFFFDKNNQFWFWNFKLCMWEETDITEIMNGLEKELNLLGQTVHNHHKTAYLQAFKMFGRRCIPDSSSKSWIQFKNLIFDMKNNKTFGASPQYFICNPIPYDLGKTDKTPMMDKLFIEWVGKDKIQTLYEIIAYCCIIDYPIHRIFCMVGSGRNGKSKFQELLARFVGQHNISSTDLDVLLNNRFESIKLYKKTVCLLGETNFGTLNRTSMLKKLTGQDLVGFERKNQTPFDDYNYAKIIVNSNSLPISEDTSEGFYRRWEIIDFPNNFPEGKNILDTIPSVEYNNLALKITKIIPSLLEKGRFTGEGSIEDRKQKYILASNPLPLFLQHCCDEDDALEGFVLYSKLYNVYVQFLNKMKRRIVPKREFKKAMLLEGYDIRRCEKNYVNGWFFEGVTLKEEIKMILSGVNSILPDFSDKTDKNYNLVPLLEPEVKNSSERSVLSGNQDLTNTNYLLQYIKKKGEVNEGELTKNHSHPNKIYQSLHTLETQGDIFQSPIGVWRILK